MVSNTTQISAGLTGLFQIPQCSCGASSLDLSDKASYPYFFRTLGNVVVYGGALMEWIRQMNWSMFALVYTDDDVGQQSKWAVAKKAKITIFSIYTQLYFYLLLVLTSMLSKSYEYGITPMSQIPLYDLDQDEIASKLLHEWMNEWNLYDTIASLQTLITSGSRIVLVADSNPANQIMILQTAR